MRIPFLLVREPEYLMPSERTEVGDKRKYFVIVAYADYGFADMKWTHDKAYGFRTMLQPQINIQEEIYEFDDEISALECMKQKWAEVDIEDHKTDSGLHYMETPK